MNYCSLHLLKQISFKPSKLLHSVIFVSLLIFVQLTQAQNFPNRPVKVMVTYPAGGSSDLITRVIAQKLSDLWGVPVLVENKGGAAGAIGMEYAASQANDGYAMLVGNVGPTVINPSLSKVNYSMDSFVPITLVAAGPNILVVNAKSEYKTLGDILKKASASSTMNYGTSGGGSISQLSTELLMRQAKIKMQEIPYKGGLLAINDLLGGQIDMIISDALPASGFLAAGTLRPLAITSAKRSSLFPDIPTFAEAGVEGVEATSWWASFLPAGTPRNIQEQYSKALFTILAMPDVKERFAKLGVEAVPTSMGDTKKFVDAESAKYAKLIKENNIKGN